MEIAPCISLLHMPMINAHYMESIGSIHEIIYPDQTSLI